MKKVFSALIAIIMVLSINLSAFADGAGSIVIKKTVKDQEYKIYMMATLDSYDSSKGAYLYTPVNTWKAFFDQYTTGEKTYFEYNSTGNIILKDGVTVDSAAFAKAALAYAEAQSIASTGAAKKSTADNAEVVFDNLELGYYIIDSSLGALCSLTTTDPVAEVEEKNAKPSADKQVEEDNGKTWGEVNDADIYQTVNFKTVVTVQKGAQNYVLHDKMDAGLTYTGISSVQVGGVDVAAENYTVTPSAIDTCTFEIAFDNDYVASLTAGTDIVVMYTAVLNENAVIAGDGNVNETWLVYGGINNITYDITTTYTYQFDLVKTDADDKLLDGAEFKLYNSSSATTPMYFLKDANGYYVTTAGTEGATDTLVVSGGKITVRGLDSDTYSLEETKAPVGYNNLTSRQSFEIDGSNLSAAMDATDNTKYASGGVRIINKTGSVLPETGGIGSQLLIVFGGAVILVSGVLLFAKKRMSQVEE